MEKHRISYYLEKYSLGTITAEEWQELQSLAQEPANAALMNDFVNEQFDMAAASDAREQDSGIAERFVPMLMKAIDAEKRPALVVRGHFLHRWWVAASVLLLLGVGAYLWYQQSRPPVLLGGNRHLPTDIDPGREGAILTLADGTRMVLDSLGNGMIATQNGSLLLLQNGQLAYDPTGEGDASVMYNTISTPKGRQFNLWLPDGTRVWLNAASSLRYPTSFPGGERRVEVRGEAYFEVAPDTKQPFRVDINGQAEVEVLGTHFNINAYADERSISTTLLEGSIKILVGQNTPDDPSRAVAANRPAVTLKPGQQAQFDNTPGAGRQSQPGINATMGKNGINVINDANIEKVMAWKNGLFDFNGVELEEIMRQLERWYNIEVVYESTVPAVKLRGKMTRGVTLNGLIKNLGKLGVHCRLEDRKLIVLP